MQPAFQAGPIAAMMLATGALLLLDPTLTRYYSPEEVLVFFAAMVLVGVPVRAMAEARRIVEPRSPAENARRLVLLWGFLLLSFLVLWFSL